MSNLKEIERILGELGFTKYEISIIIELYSRGSLKADELASFTNVPLVRIYDTLDLLKRKNFVTSSQGRPKIFTAINPQIAISSIIKQREIIYDQRLSNITLLGNSFLDYAHSLYLKNHTQITPDELLSQFSTLNEAENFTIQSIESAKNEILIFTHVFNWFDRVHSSLETAIKNGCKVRLLMQTKLESQFNNQFVDPKLLSNMGIKVKKIPTMGKMTRGTIVDGKTVVFVIWANEGMFDGKPKRIYHPHYSSNPGIIEVFTSYFNYLWNDKS